jgi:hypothetical protein
VFDVLRHSLDGGNPFRFAQSTFSSERRILKTRHLASPNFTRLFNLRVEFVDRVDEIEGLLFELKKFGIVAAVASMANLALRGLSVDHVCSGSGSKAPFDFAHQGLY